MLLQGNECARAWRRVLATLPLEISQRIRAWIVDNVTGIRALAHQKNWVLQLCHFHLISQLQSRRGHWRRAIPGTKSRGAIYSLIRQIIDAPYKHDITLLVRQLESFLRDPDIPFRLRMIGTEFIRNIHHHRAYRNYPEWHLPTTTCALESMGSSIRERVQRARNLRTPHSLQLWVTALIRMRKSIRCHAKDSTE